jgi:hypothetical protein
MPKAPEFTKDSGACPLDRITDHSRSHVRPHLVLEIPLTRKKGTGLQSPGPGPDELDPGRVPGWLQSGDFPVRGEKTKGPHHETGHPATHYSAITTIART